MTEIEERKKVGSRKWQIFYSPLSLIILLIAFVFIARAAWSVYNHQLTSDRDRERVQNELVATEQRLTTLQKQVAVLGTSQGVDEEIRSKFNVSKAGEGVAVIIGGVTSTNNVSVSFAKKNWWQKILEFFMRD
jgi:cell division protein FtsB